MQDDDEIDDDEPAPNDEPCYVVVDVSPEGEGRGLFRDQRTWPWRVIGDGETLQGALETARDYEHEDTCPHCGRSTDDGAEDGWRVYRMERVAWELLTCGGPYERALQPDVEFLWCAESLMFVRLEATCVACKGTGEVKSLELDRRQASGVRTRRTSCKACSGCGTLSAQQLELERRASDAPTLWIPPPESACLWRGDVDEPF